MLAFTVNDTKSFMNLLLKGDTFDAFLFRQGELTTFASFLIEGKRNMDFLYCRGAGGRAFPLCALGGNASLCISGNQGE